MTAPWRTWTNEHLEREYSPSTTVADLGAEIHGYARASAVARSAAPPAVVPYGSHPTETIDLYRPGGPGPTPP